MFPPFLCRPRTLIDGLSLVSQTRVVHSPHIYSPGNIVCLALAGEWGIVRVLLCRQSKKFRKGNHVKIQSIKGLWVLITATHNLQTKWVICLYNLQAKFLILVKNIYFYEFDVLQIDSEYQLKNSVIRF